MLLVSRLITLTMLSASMSVALAASSFEVEAICRTAIASIMGRDPKITQVTRTAGDVLFLTYVRPMDNFVWTYRTTARTRGVIARSVAHRNGAAVQTCWRLVRL